MASLSPVRPRRGAWVCLACLSVASSAALSGCIEPTVAGHDYPTEPRGSVPEGFVADRVFICRGGGLVEEDGIKKQVIIQEEPTGDLGPLLAALAVPSDRGEGEFFCTSDLERIPILWLVDAEGTAIDAAWPTTICHKASGKPETQKAVDALAVADSFAVSGSVK